MNTVICWEEKYSPISVKPSREKWSPIKSYLQQKNKKKTIASILRKCLGDENDLKILVFFFNRNFSFFILSIAYGKEEKKSKRTY